jgi:hypothetical protein
MGHPAIAGNWVTGSLTQQGNTLQRMVRYGRGMPITETHMKENQHVQPVVNLESNTVTFRVKGHNDIVLDVTRLHPDILRRAAMVGMAQVRIVDAAAVGMTDDEGNILGEEERIQMKYDRMEALVLHYHTGTSEWSRRGTGGEGFGKSLTIEAVARVKGIDYEAAKEMIAKYAEKKFGGDTKKTLAKLREGAEVAKAMLEIKAERLPKAKADADEMLEEMGE